MTIISTMNRFAWAAALVASVLTAGCEFTVQSGEDPKTPPPPPANGTEPATPGTAGTGKAPPSSLASNIAKNTFSAKINLVELLKGKGGGGDGTGTGTTGEPAVGNVVVKVLNGQCDDFLVDGLTIGATSGFESPITTGPHEFQCAPTGKAPMTQTADVQANQTIELTFDVADPANNKAVPVNTPPPEGRPNP